MSVYTILSGRTCSSIIGINVWVLAFGIIAVYTFSTRFNCPNTAILPAAPRPRGPFRLPQNNAHRLYLPIEFITRKFTSYDSTKSHIKLYCGVRFNPNQLRSRSGSSARYEVFDKSVLLACGYAAFALIHRS